METYLNTGPELVALRKTSFYLHLRPFIKARAVQRGLAPDSVVFEDDDPKLHPADRLYFGLEFVFGDIFRNVRSRLWIKTSLQKMLERDVVDAVGSHFLYRAYINELVVLLERLQRLVVLLAKALGASSFISRCEADLLQFFNPRIPEKRNANHHDLYLSYPRSYEVEALLNGNRSAEAFQLFSELMSKQIDWMDYTEQEISKFLSGFLERVHSQLKVGDVYIEATSLPPDFRLSTGLKGNLRGKYDHPEAFREANGDSRI